MKRFKCSLRMCFPHKVWVKEWQRYHSENHSNIKCMEKYMVDSVTTPVTYIYDDKVEHRCYVCDTPRSDALEIRGWKASHICVDGG